MFSCFFSDINELPLNPCPNDIYVDEAASNGYVVWTIKPSDPDNEKYENEKRLGLTSTYQKQLLTTSLKTSSPNFPFQIANEKYLVKMGVSALALFLGIFSLRFQLD